MAKLRFCLTLLLILGITLTGCSKTNGESGGLASQKGEDAQTERQLGEKVDFRVVGGGDVPDDQGSLDVKIEGEVVEGAKNVTVKGKTNLLPGAKISARLKAAEYGNLTYAESAEVMNDGTFEIEIRKPKRKDREITVEVVFSASNQDTTVTEHYGSKGEKLKGPLVYQDFTNKELIRVAKILAHYTPGQEDAVVTLEQPQWDKPADYGATSVWIEPEVSKDQMFFHVKGKSNLLEGSTISAEIDIPNHIVVGYNESTIVNPDGSFEISVRYPDDKEDFYLVLKFNPDELSRPAIKERYGENGEKLEGKLVKTYDLADKKGLKKIELKMQM